MKSVEVTGKTMDEAITSALLQLGASSDQVNIEVLDEGGKGFLGLLKKSVKIRATLKDGEEPILETAESKAADEAAAKAQSLAAPESGTLSAPSPAQPAQPKKMAEAVTVTGETVVIDDTIEQRLHKANQERGGEGKAERRQNASRGGRGSYHQHDSYKAKDRAYEREETAPEPQKAPEDGQAEESFALENERAEEQVYVIPEDAEQVKAKVVDFLTEVLKAMGIEATVTAEFSEDAILNVDIEGEGMGVIIGKRGATLDSLQYLATLVVNKGRTDHVRLKLDTEGYRARRQETLEKLAVNLARKAKRTGRPVTLEPMNPYERRIIHSILQSDRGVETHSEGEEPYRHVVITPKKRR